MISRKIIIISCASLVILLCFLIVSRISLQVSPYKHVRLYGKDNLLLSDGKLKDNIPWEGNFIEDKSRIAYGDYYSEYYMDGKLTKSVIFKNWKPVVGIIGKGDTEDTYKIKIEDIVHLEKDTLLNSRLDLLNSNNTIVISVNPDTHGLYTLKYNSIKPGTYRLFFIPSKGVKQKLYSFSISERGKIILESVSVSSGKRKSVGAHQITDSPN